MKSQKKMAVRVYKVIKNEDKTEVRRLMQFSERDWATIQRMPTPPNMDWELAPTIEDKAEPMPKTLQKEQPKGGKPEVPSEETPTEEQPEAEEPKELTAKQKRRYKKAEKKGAEWAAKQLGVDVDDYKEDELYQLYAES